MKLISCYTKSHQKLVDEWFLPSLQDEFDLDLCFLDEAGGKNYMEESWSQGIRRKSDTIIQAIQDNPGEIIAYTDVDVQFFGPAKPLFESVIDNKDIVLQLNDPKGNFCSGLFVMRCNELVLQLWREVRKAVDREGRDQLAFNRIIRSMEGIRYGYLPTDKVFGGGTFLAQIWEPGKRLHIPRDPIIHHANYVLGMENKIGQLEYVKDVLCHKRPAFQNQKSAVEISIITPVFNGEHCIEECLLSVIDQNFSGVEHIIIDGNSQDKTMEIVKSFAKDYPHIRWVSEEDRGQSHAMNKGVRMARGEHIGVLNADDFYEPNTLERAIEYLKELPKPAFVAANCRVWAKEEKFRYVNKPRHLKFDQLLLGFDFYPFPVNPSAYFYSALLHEEVGYYDENDHFAMDLDFILRVAQCHKLHYVDEIWGNYRFLEGTKTYDEIKSGRNKHRFDLVMEKYVRQLPLLKRMRVRAIRGVCAFIKSIKYGRNRLKYYLKRPREIRGLLQRKGALLRKVKSVGIKEND